jgi:hypothetical protein
VVQVSVNIRKSGINLACEYLHGGYVIFSFMSSKKFTVGILKHNSFGLKLMKQSKNMGTEFYVYHHSIVIPTPLDWSGPRQECITIASVVKMG